MSSCKKQGKIFFFEFEVTHYQQREILKRLFHLEKETHENKTKVVGGYTIRFKKYKVTLPEIPRK